MIQLLVGTFLTLLLKKILVAALLLLLQSAKNRKSAMGKILKSPPLIIEEQSSMVYKVKPKKLIRLSKSSLSLDEKEAVMRVLDKEFLGMGAEVQQFEQALSEYFGRPAVCVVNGTAALHLAVQACGIGPGDQVLVPSLTYVSSFQAISATGAKPIACDIDPETYVLDWRDAELRITPHTKAVMPVHYGGGVGDLKGIYAFARRHNLRVIEDAAHAFGTTHCGNLIGGVGDVVCFSFDGIKNITSGEGGCVLTDDPAVLSNVQDARLLGVRNDSKKRYNNQRSWEFDVAKQGWRYHMSNIMAAIGLEQLKRFPTMAQTRQRLARCYDELLCGHPCIKPLLHNYDNVIPHIYVVRILGMSDREVLQGKLSDRGIQTGVHYQPNHLLSLYRNTVSEPLTVTEQIFPELISLPLHVGLTESEVGYIVKTLDECLNELVGAL